METTVKTVDKNVYPQSKLEAYFDAFRKNIIGIDQYFSSPFGKQKILYTDWVASGRMYGPIEHIIKEEIAPFVGNTHTETTCTGSSMTIAYHKAKHLIKSHVNAGPNGILISSNSGMTGVTNKFQRMLGLRVHERFKDKVKIKKQDRPIIFCTHMEHHSNQTSWIETIGDVKIIKADAEGRVDLDHFSALLEKHKDRKIKIAAVTSCSNVTGIKAPYYDIARMVHAYGGYCFVDFATSAPYVEIDMNPPEKACKLDAIYFSPHKFLGGPSSTGILVFDRKLYSNKIPDDPGGGTLGWTNPWGRHKYFDEIEAREDGGTPSFIQTIRAALSIKLKEEMGVENILAREEELLNIMWDYLKDIPNLHMLAPNIKERLGVISFYVEDAHYNLIVKLLNDRYGVQTRGGCSCAGTYGHYLLSVSKKHSKIITDRIDCGDYSTKPGWVRISIHPTTTNAELIHALKGIKEVAENHQEWAKDYYYDAQKNEFFFKDGFHDKHERVDKWFSTPLS